MNKSFLHIAIGLLYFFCFSYLLCACGDANSNLDDTLISSDEPYMATGLIKFTDDKYREYILAEHGFSPIVTMNQGMHVPEELVAGTNPYSVKLPNGYWVINWRWGDCLAMQDFAILLPYKWETFTHWKQTWDVPENPLPYNEYIADYCCVFRRTIDKHLSINMDVKRWTELDFLLYEIPVAWRFTAAYGNSTEDIPVDEKKYLDTSVRQQDSLEAIYIQRLTEIIENGDFEKVYNKQPKQNEIFMSSSSTVNSLHSN